MSEPSDDHLPLDPIPAARWRTLRNLIGAGHEGAPDWLLCQTLSRQKLALSGQEMRDLLAYLRDLNFVSIEEDWSSGQEIWIARLLPVGLDYALYRRAPIPEIPRPKR